MQYVLFDEEPKRDKIMTEGLVREMYLDPLVSDAFDQGIIDFFSVDETTLYFVLHHKVIDGDHCEQYLKKSRSQMTDSEYSSALNDCRSQASLDQESEYWFPRYQMALEAVYGSSDVRLEEWMIKEKEFFENHSFSFEDRFYLRQIFAPMISEALKAGNSVEYALAYAPVSKQKWVDDLVVAQDYTMTRGFTRVVEKIKNYYSRYPPTPSREETKEVVVKETKTVSSYLAPPPRR